MDKGGLLGGIDLATSFAAYPRSSSRHTSTTTLAWDGSLTRRAHEVAMVAAQGLSTTQIAQVIGVSVNTVKKHLKSVYEKLDVHSRAELSLRLLRGPGEVGADKKIPLPPPRKLSGGALAYSHTVSGRELSSRARD